MRLSLILLSVLLSSPDDPAEKPSKTPTPAVKFAVPAVGFSGASAKPAAPRPKLVPNGRTAEASLRMKPDVMTRDLHRESALMLYPRGVTLTAERPKSITKEPRYLGTPRYGKLVAGTSADAELIIAVDESADDARILLDANRNGDLTDDPAVSWKNIEKSKDGNVMLSGDFRIPARWGEGSSSKTGDYAISLLGRKGSPRLSAFRIGARTGKLTIGEKTYRVVLADNSADAIYRNPSDPKAGIGVWLLVDFDGDGTFRPTKSGREVFDTNSPILVDGTWYLAEFPVDGSKLSLREVEAPPETPQVARNPLLKVGQTARDFEMLRPDGSKTKLSAGSGKIRIIDFWATWCGPCLAAMPELDSLHNRLKTQGVEIVALCVMDERDSFDRWVRLNREKYHFPVYFDPAGANHEAGGISHEWGVYAIPTTYVLDRDSKVLGVYTGLSPANLKALVELLRSKGLDLPDPSPSRAADGE